MRGQMRLNGRAFTDFGAPAQAAGGAKATRRGDKQAADTGGGEQFFRPQSLRNIKKADNKPELFDRHISLPSRIDLHLYI